MNCELYKAIITENLKRIKEILREGTETITNDLFPVIIQRENIEMLEEFIPLLHWEDIEQKVLYYIDFFEKRNPEMSDYLRQVKKEKMRKHIGLKPSELEKGMIVEINPEYLVKSTEDVRKEVEISEYIKVSRVGLTDGAGDRNVTLCFYPSLKTYGFDIFSNGDIWNAAKRNLRTIPVLIKPTKGENKVDKTMTQKELNKKLCDAAENGQLDEVKDCLVQGADVHAYNDYALRWASENGHLEVVKELIAHGADVHADDDFALCWAAYYGHLEVVKELIVHGADVHADDDDALCWAARNGYLEVVKELIACGANVHARNDFALRWAKNNEHLEVVNYLNKQNKESDKQKKENKKSDSKQQQQGEKKMTGLLNELLNVLRDTATEGVMMAASTTGAESLCAVVEKLMGDNFPQILNVTPVVKLKPAIVSAAVYAVCYLWGDKVPKSEVIESLAKSAMTASFYETTKPYLQPLINAVSDLWKHIPETKEV